MPWACHRLRAAIVDFADGALDERSRVSVERHLAGCPTCAAAVLELREIPAEIRRRLAVEPSEEFWTRQRDAILRAVERTPRRAPEAPPRRRAVAWSAIGSLAAAAAAVLIVVGSWSASPPTVQQVAKTDAAPATQVATNTDDASTSALDDVVTTDPWTFEEGSLLSLADDLGGNLGEAADDSLI